MTGGNALASLMKWAQREEWRDDFTDIIDRHLASACAGANVEVEDLPSLIGEQEFMMLWGCAFEDFLSRRLDDGRNVVDDYLKRRGWKESATTRAYMTALRSSVMSLYEVSGIVVGESFLARDLVRGGEPVRISEKSATKSLRQWDHIAARVVGLQGKKVIAGAVLSFRHQLSAEILASLRRASRKAQRETAKLMKSFGRDIDKETSASLIDGDMLLGASAFMFSTVWLSDYLSAVLEPRLPQVSNTDGEPLEFQTVHYPLLPGTTQQMVRAALATIPELKAENDHFWNWMGAKASTNKSVAAAPKGKTFITTMEDGRVVLGNVELKGKTLTLTANSRGRAERGRALLDGVLKGLTRAPLVESQTMEQMMAARDPARPKPSSGLSPEDERAFVHESLDRHYRQLLDEPIPALGDATPMKAIKTAKGREKVVAWLKTLENHTATMPKDDPMGSYDFAWLWEELGLTDRRL